jgi:uncharacterized repeat protein (TIGR03803 family)
MRSLSAALLASAAALLCLPSTHAQTFTALHTFTFQSTDGSYPEAAVTEDSSGNLYGTTLMGGTQNSGTVFKISSKGSFSLLHSFGETATDGVGPYAPLLLNKDGDLFGTTFSGGDYCDTMSSSPLQCGTVFKITSSGTETVIHEFEGETPSSEDGAFPLSGLIAANSGNAMYGTTWGGLNGSAVYEITPSGRQTILYDFLAQPNLYGSLVQDVNGDLWGTNGGGNDHPCEATCGAVFRLQKTSSGWVETTTYQFTGKADGSDPVAGLVYDSVHHVFYGVTEFGGSNLSACYDDAQPVGCGVLYELDSTGTKLTVLHTFAPKTDGSLPVANLILDPIGDLYGTTFNGGADGVGTVFVYTFWGQFMTLHTFTGGTDGANPIGSLTLDLKRATLYGTTHGGGDPSCQCGGVYSIAP